MTGFEKLLVWQKSKELYQEVILLVDVLPYIYKKSLGDQMSRSALSIASNIAEGRGRATTKEYLHFLRIAKGSLEELRCQLQLYDAAQYDVKDTYQKACLLCVEISKMLYVLMKRLREKQINSSAGTQKS